MIWHQSVQNYLELFHVKYRVESMGGSTKLIQGESVQSWPMMMGMIPIIKHIIMYISSIVWTPNCETIIFLCYSTQIAGVFVVHSFLTSSHQNIIGIAKFSQRWRLVKCEELQEKSELDFPFKIPGHGGIISRDTIHDHWWCKTPDLHDWIASMTSQCKIPMLIFFWKKPKWSLFFHIFIGWWSIMPWWVLLKKS